MFEIDNAFRNFNERLKAKGRKLNEEGLVNLLFVQKVGTTIEVAAKVKSSPTSDAEFYVDITFNQNGTILHGNCTCSNFDERYVRCSHVAAVIYAYMKHAGIVEDEAEKMNKEEKDSTKTSGLIFQFLDSYQMERPLPIEPIHLQAYIDGPEESCFGVSFKIGTSKNHMYPVKNICYFLDDVKIGKIKNYGKFLNKPLTISAFDDTSRKLIRFLNSAENDCDICDSKKRCSGLFLKFFSSEKNFFDNELYFSGRYLDELVDILKNEEVMAKDYFEDWLPLHFVKKVPELRASIEKSDDHYCVTADGYEFAKGNRYLYFVDFETEEIQYIEYDKNLLCFYQILFEAKGKPLMIAKKDMTAFMNYMYPYLQERTVLTVKGFNPEEFIVHKPVYEMYVDYENEVITCYVQAVYKDKKYSLVSNEDLEKRDKEDEENVAQIMASMFDSFNPIDRLLMLRVKEEADLFDFLSEKIPALHQLGTVYVSDSLNKFRVVKMPSVSVGISVKKDLLQLELETSDLSIKDVSEILSKYNRKKKYYKLKNGVFISLNSENLKELVDLKDSLFLSDADITKGKIYLPKYRSLYINQLSENKSYHFAYDRTFSNLIDGITTIKNNTYDAPDGLHATLRSYQLEGMRWLCKMRDNGFGALLADDMGLGKTIQVISMLGNWKDRKKTLIVCSASLVYNWNAEIEKFMPSLPHSMVLGTSEERKNIILHARDNEILLTSYHLLQRDAVIYESAAFDCEVIDEAQNIKNPLTMSAKSVKLINAKYRIALTGTPIENTLSELWSVFDYMMPGFFGSYQYFRKQFELPIVKKNDIAVTNRLNQMISPFILRRTKKDVLKDLPEKMEEIYYASLEDEQKKLYEAKVHEIKVTLEKQTDEEFKKKKMYVLAELTKLRELCCDPGLLYGNYSGNSSKKEMCFDLIQNAVEGGHKVLLFSQFTSMLDEIASSLEKDKIDYFLLKGNTSKEKRSEMVNAFQKGDTPVFLISLKAGGTGLNLTAADMVIHYDPWWNTAAENQASDRAHRIGQKNVVTVYKLIMKDTVEERILALQDEKNDLVSKVLSGEGIEKTNLTKEDFLKLL